MQEKGENIVTLTDKIRAVKYKIIIWDRKSKEANFEIFPRTLCFMLKLDLKELNCNHLTLLAGKLGKYFFSFKISEYEWRGNSFASTEVSGLSLPEEEGHVEIRNNRCLKVQHQDSDLDCFWISAQEE
jgi:hypothetical protein